MTTFKEGLNTTLSSLEYHGMERTYSSSQLKDLLENEEVFLEKYIKKSIPREENPAFDIGTYFHTAILEPHNLKLDCAVYEGIRRGKEWDKFKEENSGRAIITKSEMTQAEGLVNAVKNSKLSMRILAKGTPEVSAFAKLTVSNGGIYHNASKSKLGLYGWESVSKQVSGTDIVLKVRADFFSEDDTIVDLKSTTGNVKYPSLMKKKVSDLNYDLSTSLYLDIFSLALSRPITKFIWIFASKDVFNCKPYLASPNNVRVGRAKWKYAVLKLAECVEKGWDLPESIGMLEPQFFELERIRERTEDIL